MKKLTCLILLLSTVLLNGCLSSFTKQTPQIHYMFSGPSMTGSRYYSSTKTLQVLPMRVVLQFASNGFVYRTGQTTYLSDYYHVFFIPPEERLTQLTAASISQHHSFGAVGDAQNPLINSSYFLTGTINALYADYQNKQRPQAVLSIRYVLSLRNGTVLLDKTYEESVRLKAKTAQALMNAWNGEIQTILYRLNADLARAVRR